MAGFDLTALATGLVLAGAATYMTRKKVAAPAVEQEIAAEMAPP